MTPIALEIQGSPQSKDEWEKALADAAELALAELRAKGLTEEQLAEARQEIAKHAEKITDGEALDELSMRQCVSLCDEVVRLLEKMPDAIMGLGKSFSLKGEHAHNYQMGVTQSEIVTALACVEHARKLLKHVADCDCKRKQVKPASA